MMTTIKVSSETRDLLKAQAARAQLTLGGYLDHLARQAGRRERFEELQRAIEATSAEDLAAYRTEASEWEQLESEH